MKLVASLLAAAIVLCLMACGQSDTQSNGTRASQNPRDKQNVVPDNNGAVPVPGPPENDAVETAAEELANQSYEDVRGSSDCTDDCSGHEQGWEWAKENRIFDSSGCSGDSDSFIEGCEAYAEEVQERVLPD